MWKYSKKKKPLSVRFLNRLGCRSNTCVEFIVLKDMGHAKNKVMTLNFRKMGFHLLKKSFQLLVSRTTRETALRDKEEKNFKDAFHGAPTLAIPKWKKTRESK